jgi:UDP-3-O-[3-hydroxymyristoyl] glucosamine N-acyltransferase
MRATKVQKHHSAFSLGELGERFEASIKGDPATRIEGIASLGEARSGELSFVTGSRYRDQALASRASALIVPPSFDDLEVPRLVHANPYLLFARIAQLFHQPPRLNMGIHPTAFVSDGADLAEEVRIGPLAYVGPGARIGARTSVFGGAYIGTDAEIGEDCTVYPGVLILDGCRLGNRVIIHGGTVIGSDGFGYVQDEAGRSIKIPQMGYVRIDDDVEIGSNCSIDRATFDFTWIQQGVKIDNLVQIAHNVIVGEHSILVAQVGISGSTRLGRHVILAGQVGLADHIEIGDGTRVAAKSGVAHSIRAGQDMIGLPAVPRKQWFKTFAHVQKLSHYRDEIKDLRRRVQELENRLNGEKS